MFGRYLDYLRRRTEAAVLAGMHDAVAAWEGRGGEVLPDDQAAKALLELITAEGAVPATGTTPQLGAAAASGPPALTAPPKRGPGRPRKFQEPPGPEE